MSVAASVALAVAERVERSGGPRAGLLAWKTLAGNSSDGEVRGKALIAALRCALALRDTAALADLTTLWEGVDRGVWDEPIAALCKELTRARLAAQATALAGSEARRHRTALSLYLWARCLDVTRDAHAVVAFRDARVRAEKEGAHHIEQAARVRRAVLLSTSWLTMPDALDEARQVDLTPGIGPARATPASRLAIARVLLFAPSRFTRAGAIGTLDDLICSDKVEPALAARALSLIASWVDDVGDALTPLEFDRLLALFGRERVMKVAPGAKLALLALREPFVDERATDIMNGRYEAPTTATASSPPSGRHDQILDVVVAMRDRSPVRAARSLRVLAEAEERGEHVERQALAVAFQALVVPEEDNSAELRDAAVRFFAARLARASFGAPPKGFLALADALVMLGHEDLSNVARRAAAVAKEPGAADSLSMALARAGWELARKGERTLAIQKLREAKALLE